MKKITWLRAVVCENKYLTQALGHLKEGIIPFSVFLLLTVTTIRSVYAQERDKDNTKITEVTLVGTKLPDYTLPIVHGYVKPYGNFKVPLASLQGKWLILYFWTRNCDPCIRTFPKLREIKKTNKNDLEVMLVGINDQYNPNTPDFYAGVSAVQRFKLPIAYDSVLVKKLSIIYSGTIVVVNPKGAIEHVCIGTDLTEKKIRKIIARKE